MNLIYAVGHIRYPRLVVQANWDVAHKREIAEWNWRQYQEALAQGRMMVVRYLERIGPTPCRLLHGSVEQGDEDVIAQLYRWSYTARDETTESPCQFCGRPRDQHDEADDSAALLCRDPFRAPEAMMPGEKIIP